MNNFRQMSVIDEKQEAIARIRMAIDNDKKARLNLESAEATWTSESESALPESESSDLNTWYLGSPEGKKMNLHVMAVASADPQYRSLDERLRNFIACNMPEEAVHMRMEDDIFVGLEFQFQVKF